MSAIIATATNTTFTSANTIEGATFTSTNTIEGGTSQQSGLEMTLISVGCSTLGIVVLCAILYILTAAIRKCKGRDQTPPLPFNIGGQLEHLTAAILNLQTPQQQSQTQPTYRRVAQPPPPPPPSAQTPTSTFDPLYGMDMFECEQGAVGGLTYVDVRPRTNKLNTYDPPVKRMLPLDPNSADINAKIKMIRDIKRDLDANLRTVRELELDVRAMRCMYNKTYQPAKPLKVAPSRPINPPTTNQLIDTQPSEQSQSLLDVSQAANAIAGVAAATAAAAALDGVKMQSQPTNNTKSDENTQLKVV